ncbi:MAG: hypothetical protein ACREE6_16770 [Limisphaerales bacterium]
MRQRCRLYKRKKGGRYYIHDDATGKQDSLHTSDRAPGAPADRRRRHAGVNYFSVCRLIQRSGSRFAELCVVSCSCPVAEVLTSWKTD